MIKNRIIGFKFSKGLDVLVIKTDYFKIKFWFEGRKYDYKVIPTKQGNKLNLKDFKDIFNHTWCYFWYHWCNVKGDVYVEGYIRDNETISDRETTLSVVIPTLHYVCVEKLGKLSPDKVLKHHKKYKRTKPKTIINQYREHAERYITDVINEYNREELTDENQSE